MIQIQIDCSEEDEREIAESIEKILGVMPYQNIVTVVSES